MIKMIIGFLAIFVVVFFGSQGAIAASGREKLQFDKVLGYSLMCATLATGIATAIVVLF